MSIAVLSSIDSVLIDSTSTETVTTAIKENLVVSNETSAIITVQEQSTILVETIAPTVVVHGTMGPPGKDGISEEDMVYAKRIDFLEENTIYRGEAPVGTSEDAAGWRLRLINIAEDGDISEKWASGNASFDKVWVNRVLYTYL
jgi:hypothetical protein